MTYRFDNILHTFDSPFISWANLDCCNGWVYDEEYLLHAVQEGKKLFAEDFIFFSKRRKHKTVDEAVQYIETIRASLPEDVELTYFPNGEDMLEYSITRKGRLSDFYDLDEVFSFYEKLSLPISEGMKTEIRSYCNHEISDFIKGSPYNYKHSTYGAQLITTGLLLGYPIESTCSLMHGF